jgi:hypothetical protein
MLSYESAMLSLGLNDEGRELQCSLSEIHCGPVLNAKK